LRYWLSFCLREVLCCCCRIKARIENRGLLSEQPRRLLRSVPGVELVEIEDAGMCCGSAGTYNLLQPRAARELGERKARAILAARPDLIATANPGCALQLAASLRRLGRGDLPIVHPVELLG